MVQSIVLAIIPISYFFFICYAFGYSILSHSDQSVFEKTTTRIFIGIASLIVVGTVLNFVNIPLDWRSYLLLSLIIPIFKLFKKQSKSIGTLGLSTQELCIIAIFLISLIIYVNGSFVYPWLENDDSWAHAGSIKYVMSEKNLNAPGNTFQYLNPYPPGYAIVFGALHQLHPSLYWTLKFFNALIICLGFPFFYLMAKELTSDKTKAALACFFLAAIPCYLSHFIWAHSLCVTLFFGALFCLLKCRKNNQYMWPAIITIAAIFLTQPTQSIKFVFLFGIVVLCTFFIYKTGLKRAFIILALSSFISLLWWGPVLQSFSKGKSPVVLRKHHNISGQNIYDEKTLSRNLFDPWGGSATRRYTLSDYVFVQKINMINNPLGIGLTLSLLALFGIYFSVKDFPKKDRNERLYRLIILGWLVFTFLGMNSATFNLPIGLTAFRFWMLFAIPVSFLAAETSICVITVMNRIWFKRLTLVIIVFSVIMTAGIFKYSTNTSIWPWGVYWHSKQEVLGYLKLRKILKPNTKVFAFTDNLFVLGVDMNADFWSDQYKVDFDNAISLSPGDLHQYLNKHAFSNIIISQRDIVKFSSGIINERIRTMHESGLFQLIYQLKERVWIFKIL